MWLYSFVWQVAEAINKVRRGQNGAKHQRHNESHHFYQRLLLLVPVANKLSPA